MRIIKFGLAALLTAAVLLSGTIAAVSADDGQPGASLPAGPKAVGPLPAAKILERVALILGIDKLKLADAFRQAVSEQRQEGLTERLDKWVADGKLTQAQADLYSAWLAAKPDGAVIAPQAMANLLKNGKVTQAQYDAWKTWSDTKPNVVLPKPDRPNLNKPLQQRPGRLQPNSTQGNIN